MGIDILLFSPPDAETGGTPLASARYHFLLPAECPVNRPSWPYQPPPPDFDL